MLLSKGKLRAYWLVFCRNLKQLFTKCENCKCFGAYPCSIAGLKILCTDCQRMESRRLDLRLYADRWR